MAEYERPRAVQRAPLTDDDRTAQREFIDGLQVMSTVLRAHVVNFASISAQIMGEPDSWGRIQGMMEFAARLREVGFEQSLDAIAENSGVRVNVQIPRFHMAVPGIVVGLVNATFDEEHESFEGVAVVENNRGQQAFVNVRISPDGRTTLKRAGDQPDEPETQRFLREIYR